MRIMTHIWVFYSLYEANNLLIVINTFCPLTFHLYNLLWPSTDRNVFVSDTCRVEKSLKKKTSEKIQVCLSYLWMKNSFSQTRSVTAWKISDKEISEPSVKMVSLEKSFTLRLSIFVFSKDRFISFRTVYFYIEARLSSWNIQKR